MKRFDMNVGPNDGFLRVLAGMTLLASVFVGLETPWAWVAAALILTGATRRCPVYLVAGINTQDK
jgi:Protein of unknown function (DUF2892)